MKFPVYFDQGQLFLGYILELNDLVNKCLFSQDVLDISRLDERGAQGLSFNPSKLGLGVLSSRYFSILSFLKNGHIWFHEIRFVTIRPSTHFLNKVGIFRKIRPKMDPGSKSQDAEWQKSIEWIQGTTPNPFSQKGRNCKTVFHY